MNIFEEFLNKINKILFNLSKNGVLVIPNNLNGITAEIPPPKFNCDISTNVAMVLSKLNNKSPYDLAKVLIKPIKDNDDLIDDISIANPGFILSLIHI